MTANPPRIVGEADWSAICRRFDNGKFSNDLVAKNT